MVSRRQEAFQRFTAVLVVNKDRIPPEVIKALMDAWAEYMEAFGEEVIGTIRLARQSLGLPVEEER